MNKKRFIAKVLLLAMLVQYTSGPVLAYADNEKNLQEESSIEENITDDKTELEINEEEQLDLIAKNASTPNVSDGEEKVIQLGKKATATLKGHVLELTGVFDGNSEDIPEEYGKVKDSVKKIIIKDNFKIIGEANLVEYDDIEAGIFYNFKNVENIENLELLDTSEMTNMFGMFGYCTSLKELDLSNFNTENVTGMSYMFNGCSGLEELDLSNFNTENVTDMDNMFGFCTSLKELDLSNLNTEKVVDINSMFYNCYNLEELDLSSFNTENVTEMDNVFRFCTSLKELDLSNLNTENVIYMNNMFYNCTSLEKLDLSNLQAFKVTDMEEMFFNNRSLVKLDLSGFKTKNITIMNKMFDGCSVLEELDLNGFNTEKVTSMYDMFARCSNLKKLNIENFNMLPNEYRNKVDTGYMFYDATKLDELTLGKDTLFPNLPHLYYNDTKPYTGNWKVKEHEEIKYSTADNLVDSYNGEYPGTYYREKTEYDIFFNTNGGNDIEKKTVQNGSSIDRPNIPTRNGYKFIGWYTDEALTGEYNFDTPVNFDINLYAKWEEKRLSKTVIIANGEEYTDVLTGTVLANEKKASILLVNQNSISEDIMKEIKRINPTDIIISGGEHSVSKQVENKLKDYEITRISGKNRYETAKNIGEKVREISPNKIQAMLVDGTNFPDVITMSTIASEKRIPILLHNPENMEESKKIINDMEINNIIIGGGENSVSKDMENNLKSDKTIKRYGGSDRYETASIVGNAYRSMAGVSNNLIVVDGTNFPDGITVNSLASKIKAPILLTKPNNLPEVTYKDINTWKATNTIIAGGEDSVSKNIYNKVNGSERISGKDRYETAVKISQRYFGK